MFEVQVLILNPQAVLMRIMILFVSTDGITIFSSVQKINYLRFNTNCCLHRVAWLTQLSIRFHQWNAQLTNSHAITQVRALLKMENMTTKLSKHFSHFLWYNPSNLCIEISPNWAQSKTFFQIHNLLPVDLLCWILCIDKYRLFYLPPSPMFSLSKKTARSQSIVCPLFRFMCA